MAKSVEISISEECFKPAYYVYFGRFNHDDKGYVTTIVYDKRFRIDDSKSDKYFPRLNTNSFYDKSKLKLNVTDSYIGSKTTSENNIIVSVIYSNELFNNNSDLAEYDPSQLGEKQLLNNIYHFAMVTGSDICPEKSIGKIENIEYPYYFQIDIPTSYRYNNYSVSSDGRSAQTRLISQLMQSYDNSKWLYLIDCQNYPAIDNGLTGYATFIVHFYIESVNTNNDKWDIADTTIKLHEIDESSHVDNISIFPNQVNSQDYYSYFALNNGLNTTFSKTNGLITTNPLQHRLMFFGTPYGYAVEDFETVEKKDENKIINGTYSFYTKLNEYIDEAKQIDEDNKHYYFGNNQINRITFNSGSYNKPGFDKDTIENKIKQYTDQYDSQALISFVPADFEYYYSIINDTVDDDGNIVYPSRYGKYDRKVSVTSFESKLVTTTETKVLKDEKGNTKTITISKSLYNIHLKYICEVVNDFKDKYIININDLVDYIDRDKNKKEQISFKEALKRTRKNGDKIGDITIEYDYANGLEDKFAKIFYNSTMFSLWSFNINNKICYLKYYTRDGINRRIEDNTKYLEFKQSIKPIDTVVATLDKYAWTPYLFNKWQTEKHGKKFQYKPNNDTIKIYQKKKDDKGNPIDNGTWVVSFTYHARESVESGGLTNNEINEFINYLGTNVYRDYEVVMIYNGRILN